jgi:hypothetical protein
VGVRRIGEEGGDLRRRLHSELGLQRADELRRFSVALDQHRRYGGQEVPLGHAAALGGLGDGEHVPTVVDGTQAGAGEDRVDCRGHPEVAFSPAGLDRIQELPDRRYRAARHSLHSHVDQAGRIGVVDLAVREAARFPVGTGLEAHPELEADAAADPEDRAGVDHLLGGADGVVVHRPRRFQSRVPRPEGRHGRRVGAEAVDRVDVVVDFPGGRRRGRPRSDAGLFMGRQGRNPFGGSRGGIVYPGKYVCHGSPVSVNHGTGETRIEYSRFLGQKNLLLSYTPCRFRRMSSPVV